MRILLMTLLLLPLLTAPLWAASVDARLLRTVPIDKAAKQVVASPDGQQIYILTEAGDIHIFAADGTPQGTFPAGKEVTAIAPQGRNRLILISADKQEMQLVGLEPVVEIDTAGAPTLGPADAPVSIVVYDDFECPFCAKAVPLLKEAQQSYPDQVKLVFKNFPLSMHKNARAAATAALAADKQGKFWPLHDLLFENYNKLNPQKIQELAQQVGLDMTRFNTDMADPALQQRINQEMQEGQKIGVRGTPSIFINGRRLQQRNKAGFDQLIQAELARLAEQK